MSENTRLTISVIVLCLVAGSGLILAETEESDPLQPVITTSDSTISLLTTALTEKDTALLGSLLIEDVGIIMPGDKALEGRKQAMKYAPLLTELNVEDGDAVEITGLVVQRETSFHGTDRKHKEEMLSPEEVTLLHRSSKLKHLAQQEYVKIRPELQNKITPKGSVLNLPEVPRWWVVWSKTDGHFIVSARFSDLMYQGELDFVYDGQTQALKEIYGVEWFKGE